MQLERAERLINTYTLVHSIQGASQAQSGILRPLKWAAHPLNAVSAFASRTLADFVYEHCMQRTGMHDRAVIQISDYILKNREATIKIFDQTGMAISEGEAFFQAACKFDPTMTSEILSIFLHDTKMNVNDAKEVLRLLNAFHKSLERITQLAQETAELCILKKKEQYKKNLQNYCNASEEEPAGDNSYFGSMFSWASSGLSCVKRNTFQVIEQVGTKTIEGLGYYAGLTYSVGIELISKTTAELAEKPERKAVKAASSKALRFIGIKGINFFSKGAMDMGCFYLYNWGIQQMLEYGPEDEVQPVSNWVKTTAAVCAYTLPLVYYGNALYQWKNQREQVSKQINLIKNVAEKIQPLNWIDRISNAIGNRFAVEMEDENFQTNFVAQCKLIIVEEFEINKQ